jgi:hypothetical protein
VRAPNVFNRINKKGRHIFPHRLCVLPKPFLQPLSHIRYRQPSQFNFRHYSHIDNSHSAHIINAHNCYVEQQRLNFINKYLLITNIKTHNLSTQPLTDIQSLVLGLGPKFCLRNNITKVQHLNNMYESLTTLHRKIKLNMYFLNDRFDKPTIPHNSTLPKWSPSTQRYDAIITRYINRCKTNLQVAFQNNLLPNDINEKILLTTLTNLRNNHSIVIKPADKNLGVTILNTIDYNNMCLKHLNDIHTYTEILNYSPHNSYNILIDLLKNYNKYEAISYNTLKITKLATSLLQLHNHTTLRVAPFYCLPKIHKSTIAPIPGRPIVSSINTLTYHTSVYLDMQLQPILKLLKTVCTSTNTIITDLHNYKTEINSTILCADVTSLYPNIPTLLGIQTVSKVIKELNCFTDTHLDFLMDLLYWVLTNNYCEFNEHIYLQIKGTAMGTPVATSYANIFLYGIERDVIQKHEPVYYKRYIDDIFAIYNSPIKAKCFVHLFNNIVPSIKLDEFTISRKGIMLDLVIELVQSEDTLHDTIKHRLFQKPANIYQYIPPQSNHIPSVFKNFITQEVNRFNINCSNIIDFHTCTTLFKERLLARGYNLEMIHNSILLASNRLTLLHNITAKIQNPNINVTKSQLIVTINKPHFTKPIKWNDIFKITDELQTYPVFIDAFNNNRLIIGTKNDNSIGSIIINSTSKPRNNN